MPVVRPWSSWPMFADGSCTFAMSICEMLLPTSRCRAALPVPVTTTASRASAWARIVKSCVTVAPAVTVTVWSLGRWPMNWTRIRCWPAGTFTIVYFPSIPVRVPSVDPTMVTCAAASVCPFSDVTVPVTVPVCAARRAPTATIRTNVHFATDHGPTCGENPGISVSGCVKRDRPGWVDAHVTTIERGVKKPGGYGS
jgi:hypothetical protein